MCSFSSSISSILFCKKMHHTKYQMLQGYFCFNECLYNILAYVDMLVCIRKFQWISSIATSFNFMGYLSLVYTCGFQVYINILSLYLVKSRPGLFGYQGQYTSAVSGCDDSQHVSVLQTPLRVESRFERLQQHKN